MDEVRAALEVVAHPRADPASVPVPSARARRVTILAGAVALAVVAALGVWAYLGAVGRRPGGERLQKLAVLPFENLSGDAAQNFFSEGMTDEITTTLARLGTLTVIARTSVMNVSAAHVPLPEIGRRLGVQAIVEGSVLKAGDRVRISVRLIDVRSNRHLWANSFEREYRDVLALQSDVARAVAQEVRAELTPSADARLAASQPVDPAAYEKYLLGRHFVQQRNAEAAALGVEYLRQAAELDPRSAVIQAALADAYREYETWSGAGIGKLAVPIRAAAMRAIALDDRLPAAHFALAQSLYWYEWDWPGASREYRTAIDGNPSLAGAHMGTALLLQTLGRHDDAIASARRATELEPLSPAMLSDYGRILYRARRYQEAIAQFTEALRLDQGFVAGMYRLGDAQLMRRDTEGYRQTVKKVDQAGARVPAQIRQAIRAMQLTLEGRGDEARVIARAIEKDSGGDRPGEYAFALGTIYAAVGEVSRSLDWLETGIRHRAMFPLQLSRSAADGPRARTPVPRAAASAQDGRMNQPLTYAIQPAARTGFRSTA